MSTQVKRNFIVTCSVLVWTGANKHAEFLKPDSCVTTNARYTQRNKAPRSAEAFEGWVVSALDSIRHEMVASRMHVEEEEQVGSAQWVFSANA